MVTIKIFLNNHYLTNYSSPYIVRLIDIFPKLKENIIYDFNLYYKDRGEYHNTNAIDMKLFYYNKEYYLFEHKKNKYFYPTEYDAIKTQTTMKLTLNETSDKFYKISIGSYKTYFLISDQMINIKNVLKDKLKYYEYEIVNIESECEMTKELTIKECDNINEIYIDVMMDRKSFKNIIKEYINKIKNKINIYG
jgi:hypothetical protein